MGVFSKPSIPAPVAAPPPPDPVLTEQLEEQKAENKQLKDNEAARKKREKDARLRGLRGSSALFSNSFVGFGADEANLGGTSGTLGSS